MPAWASRYLGVAVLLHVVWAVLGMLWLAHMHMCAVDRQLDDLCRFAAQQESMHIKVMPLTCSLLQNCMILSVLVL